MKMYPQSQDAFLAVLAALDKVDISKEGVDQIRIWRYAPETRIKGGQWGWSVRVIRCLTDNNTAPPGALNWNGPAPPARDQQERDKQRYREVALEAWRLADAQEKKSG